MPDIILDLEGYGEISVEPLPNDRGLEQAGVVDSIRGTINKALKLPLTGLSKALMATLPEEHENDAYKLDEFRAEFEIGLTAEFGKDGGLIGIIAKIVPKGNFKCSYVWKRKE